MRIQPVYSLSEDPRTLLRLFADVNRIVGGCR